MKSVIRRLVAQHGKLRVRIDDVRDNDSLFKAGMSSFSSVQLLMALEEHFKIEFPTNKMVRETFVTIDSIVANLQELHVTAA